MFESSPISSLNMNYEIIKKLMMVFDDTCTYLFL